MKTFLGNGVTIVSLSHPWLLPCIIKIHWSTTERKYILKGSRYDNILICGEKMT